MRVNRMALVAFAALAASSSSAFALDVNKHIAAPAQLLVVWSTISEFCSIEDWHPAVADCKESKEGDDTFRVLTLKDNGGTIKEKLTGSDDTSYSYEIVESPLPVKNYSAKLWVEPDDRDPARTVIHWDATFDANGKSDEEATKVISDIFMAGLKSIKQKTLPPEGSVGGD
ncbi:MAG: SRPBCC family protein [Actinomycetota bacterium]